MIITGAICLGCLNALATTDNDRLAALLYNGLYWYLFAFGFSFVAELFVWFAGDHKRTLADKNGFFRSFSATFFNITINAIAYMLLSTTIFMVIFVTIYGYIELGQVLSVGDPVNTGGANGH